MQRMLEPNASGVYVIAATPFHDDGAIDTASIDRMVDFYLGCGVTGITVLGMMGEAPKLTHAESLAITRQVVQRAGLPVVVGVSAPGFAAMAALTKDVMDAGAGGVMIAPPSTAKTDDQIVSYYANAVEAIGSDVPFAIQDYPLSTGVVMSPGVIRRIIEQNPSCALLKHEDWPGLEKITTLRGFMREGLRHVSILCGNGGVFLTHEVERGADGANTGYAYPEMLVEVVKRIKAGDRAGAHDLFDRHLPLLRYEQQPGLGLAVRKYILKRRGAIASDAQRKPAIKLSKETVADVEFLISRLEARGVL
ncbi:L-2-keto-3-deoxyarabonate dehydratase [Variibacter gotjawalensis]|uniref:L-2-keto-3-deoxyarabonate dehydratase n=2 Tax=Variibacter gotjawalensis TaxID=1333996 RepID=A0A0S3PZW6_9BRAD|nr:4-hydroxy-tetrahydrodipicolinate synthase [Variibacter gotjawalensis]RZS49196.1 4-hydroxy-tetrahydrodipicolinate synthase [Variibacter gotjawalensis]BAT61458.1 L-2-keto-3-deoxyarabonate dehydratase [Variibacter gotjawalensis]